MRRYRYLIALLLLIVGYVSVVSITASSATTNTFAFNRKNQAVITQTAYLPDRTYLDFEVENFEALGLDSSYLALDEPTDLFVGENDIIYIVDSGNARIVLFDPMTSEIVDIFDNEEFESPKGIFVTDTHIYVADTQAGREGESGGCIFKLNLDGTIDTRFYRPESASYGQQVFEPKKIAVDSQDTMYVIAEGIFDGVIQLSDEGEFLGYFAQNDVQLTARQRLENLLFSEEQLEGTVERKPTSFSNVYVDQDGIKYSTSHGENISNLKKHNTDGSSSIDNNWGIDMALVDVYTDDQGIIYTASDEGYIYIWTNDGQFIFAFGTTSGQDVVGFYNDLVAIAVDSVGRIWTLDADSSFLQSYTPTDYSNRIYNALTLYQQGRYDEAVLEWEEVLKLNQLSVLAHNEIGRNLYSQGEYEEAMEHFILSGNRFLYSESYWEVRNDRMQENLPITIILLVSVFVVYQVVKRTNKKFAYLDVPKKYVNKVTSIRIVDDILFMFAFVKHPLDSFYYLKRKERGSYKGATIIFTAFFITYMIYTTSKGFIYQYVEPADLDLGAIVLGFFSIFVLFVLSNYLVTSINDGEGSIGEVYKGVAYSLMPLMFAMLLTTFLSYRLTLGEVIIIDLVMNAGTFGTALFIFLAVQELHNYTIRETIKSFLMTFLFMLIVAVLFAFVQIMGDQLIQFVIALVEEAIRNVFS